jgi:hypothetical protein
VTNHRNRFPARRRFLKQTAALSAGAARIGAPGLLLAAGAAAAGAPAEGDPATSPPTTGAAAHPSPPPLAAQPEGAPPAPDRGAEPRRVSTPSHNLTAARRSGGRGDAEAVPVEPGHPTDSAPAGGRGARARDGG